MMTCTHTHYDEPLQVGGRHPREERRRGFSAVASARRGLCLLHRAASRAALDECASAPLFLAVIPSSVISSSGIPSSVGPTPPAVISRTQGDPSLHQSTSFTTRPSPLCLQGGGWEPATIVGTFRGMRYDSEAMYKCALLRQVGTVRTERANVATLVVSGGEWW